MLALMGMGETGAYFVLRSLTLGNLRKQAEQESSEPDPETRVLPVWSTLVLIRGAMIEGWGLFAVVIALLSGSPLGYAATGLALALLALGFPTRNKLTQVTNSVTGRNPYTAALQ
ncbi:MAG TPA: hypothetical protein PLT93_03515 [Phycisphaerae bacterium]|nr:hypothetical protein [Phycisphaerae bacterium]